MSTEAHIIYKLGVLPVQVDVYDKLFNDCKESVVHIEIDRMCSRSLFLHAVNPVNPDFDVNAASHSSDLSNIKLPVAQPGSRDVIRYFSG